MITWTERDRKTGEERTYTTHEGLVLGTFTRVDRVMSDIYADQYYARIWDPEAGRAKALLIGSSFECFCGPWGHAEADASPELLAAHKAQEDAEVAARHAREQALRDERERKRREAEAREPRRGRWVRVVRGRKVPRGLEGFCFWTGGGRYGERAGVQVGENEGEVIWIALGNLEAVSA